MSKMNGKEKQKTHTFAQHTTYRIGNHVYYRVGMVEARSVNNVKNTYTTHIQQYFGEIKNDLFFKERAFL